MRTLFKFALAVALTCVTATAQDTNVKIRGEILSMGQTISTPLQTKIEQVLDAAKDDLNASEVLAMVMESKTGKMLTMATSNRSDLQHNTQKDSPEFHAKFGGYVFEPGSVMMPFFAALSLEVHPLDKNREKKRINTDYDKFPLSDRIGISDNVRRPSQTMADILVNSSNIGIL
jgi:cell division protein FtsI (penicillin-binding protein 3)